MLLTQVTFLIIPKQLNHGTGVLNIDLGFDLPRSVKHNLNLAMKLTSENDWEREKSSVMFKRLVLQHPTGVHGLCWYQHVTKPSIAVKARSP